MAENVTKITHKQVSIPEGCVPPTFVVPEGGYGLGGWAGTVERHYRPLNRMAHACENITFPQLHWRAVITALIDITYVPCSTN